MGDYQFSTYRRTYDHGRSLWKIIAFRFFFPGKTKALAGLGRYFTGIGLWYGSLEHYPYHQTDRHHIVYPGFRGMGIARTGPVLLVDRYKKIWGSMVKGLFGSGHQFHFYLLVCRDGWTSM